MSAVSNIASVFNHHCLGTPATALKRHEVSNFYGCLYHGVAPEWLINWT